jgi:hypothetical protein
VTAALPVEAEGAGVSEHLENPEFLIESPASASSSSRVGIGVSDESKEV